MNSYKIEEKTVFNFKSIKYTISFVCLQHLFVISFKTDLS